MNASMGDTHNLGMHPLRRWAWTENCLAWKLAQVLRGWSNPSLLKTVSYRTACLSASIISSLLSTRTSVENMRKT